MSRVTWFAAVYILFVGSILASDAENPNARPIIEPGGVAAAWEFEPSEESAWRATNHCSSVVADGLLRITSTGHDPYLHCPLDLDGGPLKLTLRARAKSGGDGAVYWATDATPIGEQQRVRLPLVHDGQWREYAVRFTVDGRLRTLRLDPGAAEGVVEVDWMRLSRWRLHPLAIEQIATRDDAIVVRVRNDSNEARTVDVNGRTAKIAPGGVVAFDVVPEGDRPIRAVRLRIVSPDLPPIERTLFFHRPQAEATWVSRTAGPVRLQVAADGSIARIYRGGELAAVLAPIVRVGGEIPRLEAREEGDAIWLIGDGVNGRLSLVGDELAVRIESDSPCEGPCLRAIGEMQQAIFAGLEYMERGDTSSSKLDVETDEHLRFAPPRRHMTMPLMAVATERAAVAISWDDMSLQPVFASPNAHDGASDHRMTLRGKKIAATIRVAAGSKEGGDARGGIEETILWAVRRRGLPPLPTPPRSADEQHALDLATLNGPLRTNDGWGHCIEPRWGRAPYGDMASTLWRLTGNVPDLPRIVPGGAHLRNDSIYFVTGRAEEWLAHARAEIRHRIAQQQPDGSYRYDGAFRRGHFESTASGLCAAHAARLLELAHLTGDAEALAAGRRTLEYMKRFRVPRGAQTWEVPLHTPDLLASAHLVWAYVRGYELTGDKTYLDEARRWALSGMPFVYQWSDRPVMAYATIAVLGATNWQAPYWIGLPVQWVGGVYAYALGLLAPHDNTLDWRQVARGILIAGRQMQYPDGPNAGTLPDSFALAEQERRPWNINPCALVSLERLLDGQVDSLAVARDERRHVVAPFAVQIADGKAVVQAQVGARYQVIVDGERVIDLSSRGQDVIKLP